MIARISRIAVVIGLVGAALTYFGMLSILPLITWVGVAVVGPFLHSYSAAPVIELTICVLPR